MQTMKYMCNALLLLMWAVLYVSIINAWTDIIPLSSFFSDEDSHHIFSDEDNHHIHEIFWMPGTWSAVPSVLLFTCIFLEIMPTKSAVLG